MMGKTGKYPEHFGPIRLKEEPESLEAATPPGAPRRDPLSVPRRVRIAWPERPRGGHDAP
jgi:hypothetical protein